MNLIILISIPNRDDRIKGGILVILIWNQIREKMDAAVSRMLYNPQD